MYKKNCPLSCGECTAEKEKGTETTGDKSTTDGAVCEDKTPIWCKNFGKAECEKTHAKSSCRKTCNICTAKTACSKYDSESTCIPATDHCKWDETATPKCQPKCEDAAG